MNELTKVTALVQRLQEIARKNNDEFRYHIEIEPARRGPLSFNFVCEETAEGHVFVDGSGPSIEAACLQAEASIEGQCKEWGYDV